MTVAPADSSVGSPADSSADLSVGSPEVVLQAPEAKKKSGRRGARFAGRFRAVQALAWWESDKWLGSAEGLLERYSAMVPDSVGGPCDLDLLAQLVAGVALRREALDTELAAHLPDTWPPARLDSLLRALLRAGAWELGAGITPSSAALSAWVEVARAFYGNGAEPGMTNAALDALSRAQACAKRN